MLKRIFIILGLCTLVVTLTACGSDKENEGYENLEPTPEELRADFELFFEENKKSIIETIATEGEDVRLYLSDNYEILMTILLDDVELDEESRTLYALSFELAFSEMTNLFGGLAHEIREAAKIDDFTLTVIFIDVNEEKIARSSFNANLLHESITDKETN